MTKPEFDSICNEATVLPSLALENEKVRKVLSEDAKRYIVKDFSTPTCSDILREVLLTEF